MTLNVIFQTAPGPSPTLQMKVSSWRPCPCSRRAGPLLEAPTCALVCPMVLVSCVFPLWLWV